MKSIATVSPYRLGLIAIAFVVILGGAVVALSLASFGKATYTARLEHTAGLRAGEDVQVAGVSSGEVKSIKLDGDEVVVEFTLDKDIKLGADTTAAVRVATLLGTHYLRIDPRGGGSLKDDEIPLDHTSVPYNLQDVLEKGSASLEELNANLLAKALSEMSKTLASGSDDLRPALKGIAAIGQVVDTRIGQAEDLIVAARDVSQQLSDSTDDIIGLMKQSQLVLDEIARRRSALSELLHDTDALARALTEIVRATDAKFGPTLRDLNVTLDALRKHKSDLTRVLHEFAPTARYLANVSGSGPWLDVYVPNLIPDAVSCKTNGGC